MQSVNTSRLSDLIYQELYYATKKDHSALENLIKRYKEQVSCGYYRNTVLHYAVRNKDLLKPLLDAFSEEIESLLSETNNGGNTVLHNASENYESLKLLIDTFPEKVESLLDEKNSSGNTVLHFAAKDNRDSLKLFIDVFGEKVLQIEDKDRVIHCCTWLLNIINVH